MNSPHVFFKVKAVAKAMDGESKLAVDIAFEKTSEEVAGAILSGRIVNAGSEPARIDSIMLSADLSELALNDARVIAGTGKMGSRIRLFDVALTPFEIASDQFLLFRKDASDCLLAGLLTWRTFLGELAFKRGMLEMRFHGDGKILAPGESVPLEKISLTRSNGWLEALAAMASQIASESKRAPARKSWAGWGTWDYYAGKFGERQILENLSSLKASGSPCNLIQIDDGYSGWGDWLSLKEDKFPSGMRSVVEKIEKRGCVAGIWLAPFLAHKK